jgi:hypothetical protein
LLLQAKHGGSDELGEGARFRLLTNWHIDRTDPLNRLISSRSHALRLEQLFVTSTDRSAMGRVRKLWREHLNIDDDQLKLFARTLAVSSAAESLEGLRDQLDTLSHSSDFAACRLVTVPLYMTN